MKCTPEFSAALHVGKDQFRSQVFPEERKTCPDELLCTRREIHRWGRSLKTWVLNFKRYVTILVLCEWKRHLQMLEEGDPVA